MPKIRRQKSVHMLRMPASAGVRDIAPVYEAAKVAAASGKNVTVACDDLNRCDAAGLQVLLALRAQIVSDGRKFEISGVPEEMAWRFQFVGLTIPTAAGAVNNGEAL